MCKKKMRQLSSDILYCSEKETRGRKKYVHDRTGMALTCLQPTLQLAAQTSLARVPSSCKPALSSSVASLSRFLVYVRDVTRCKLDSTERGHVSIGAEGGGMVGHGTKGEWMGECARGALYIGCPEYRCIKCRFDISSEHSSKIMKSIIIENWKIVHGSRLIK